MMQDTFLHIGFQVDGSERAVLSVNPDRDTSAAWYYKKEAIESNHVLHIWFYGVKRWDKVEAIFQQTKSAILTGTFNEWFV